jgi:hypothetical protein
MNSIGECGLRNSEEKIRNPKSKIKPLAGQFVFRRWRDLLRLRLGQTQGEN